MSQPLSNIKVFPSFPDTAFFSGEEFSCTLTFKNVAEPSPSSSSTSLTRLEGGNNGSRLVNSKFAGGEWMVESGRSASEGLAGVPTAKRMSPHGRSMSTVGKREGDRSRSPSLQKSHGRSKSVVVSPSAISPGAPLFEKQDPFQETQVEEKLEGNRNGVKSLTVDTSVAAAVQHASPAAIDAASLSPSPLPQISKLDLHSIVEDDASSETSSVGPSKTPIATQPTVFSNFSPRSSLDIRDSDRDLLPPIVRRQSQSRRLPRSPLSRPSTDTTPRADTLMMGYAQIQGNFMIDEALINATEFDEVKMKGVMGGKSGGGVIGVDARRSASWTGSLGTFGLGSLFGVTQPSSLAEMRDRATSKTIPVLSTPPSILFVDLRLQPGESRSFSYTFKVPKNLPPSHRGRALRISYSIVITTQRPGMSSQHLSTAEIPFRLFSHLDDHGRQPKYDLKFPIILLRDEAKTASLKENEEVVPSLPTEKPRTIRRSSTYSDKPIESSQEEFMAFVDQLLGSLGKNPLSATESMPRLEIPGTPSPTPTKERHRTLSCRDAIDVVLQRGHGSVAGKKTKVGVFEIGKNGVTVATLTLPRTTFKLGEIVDGVIDLEDGLIKCYQIRSTLESAEDIDPAVSVRSQSSIYRATRRVHGSKSEFTTFARRVQFAFEIPTGVAPTFETSSGRPLIPPQLTKVRHHWSLRLEFMTSLTPHTDPEDEPAPPPTPPDLLQLVDQDDRARTFLAAETLYCESFDCHVPVVVLPTNQEIPEDRVGLSGFVV